jgi:FkbM family methyltransferase
MLNLAIGAASTEDGRSVLITERGKKGHGVYGPYEFREPGSYAVDFTVGLVEPANGFIDPVCAVVDVVRDAAKEVLAHRRVRLSELQEGERFRLSFDLDRRSKLEYRVWTSGAVALRIDEHRRVFQFAGHGEQPIALEFPDEDENQPAFFRRHRGEFRSLFERGFQVSFLGDEPVLSRGGISFHVRTDDDFMFIGEVFDENVYQFLLEGDSCVVDVGMNVGYSTLRFAGQPAVKEVHSFEPFPSTFHRAVDNIALNPALAPKITVHCAGLSDRTWEGEIGASDSLNSGSNTVVADVGDRATAIALIDAAEALGPVVDAARAKGRRVIAKIDCEGSEFAIFRSLGAAGMLDRFDAFMVEWHAIFDHLSQADLIEPLRQAGFLVFDRSPAIGNGFFYAVRMAPTVS